MLAASRLGAVLGMMWQLARDAWILAGSPIPAYRREETPVRLIRPGERSAGDSDD